MKFIIPVFLFLISLTFAISCGEQGVTLSGNNSKGVPLKINIVTPEEIQVHQSVLSTLQLEDFLEFIKSISVTVSGDFSSFIRTFPVGESIVLFVPPGTDITFIVSLLNNIGNAICTGQTTTDIFPDIVNQVTVTCLPNTEICSNAQDDNGNTLVDCEENSCAGSQCGQGNNICLNGVCSSPPPVETDCADGVDNDADSGSPNGGTDCEDLDCSIDPVCVETVCDDGIDNDGDGDIDCDDLDCFEDDVCNEICFGGEDEDSDGSVDCADIDCNNEVCDQFDSDFICMNLQCVKPAQFETNCTNNLDDDNDGDIDCDDDDCVGFPCNCFDNCNAEPDDGCFQQECDSPGNRCLFIEGLACIESDCSDGVDNDGFEGADCADSACKFFNEEPNNCEIGTELTCDDNFDNDGDGNIDCADSNCIEEPECSQQPAEICTNNIDDDMDQLADCLDDDCDQKACGPLQGAACSFPNQSSDECDEYICSDGLDNDGNEGIDCLDPDCNAMGCGTGLACFNMECQEVLCTDDIDNDNDGDTDCDDVNCINRPCIDPQDTSARCYSDGHCGERNCSDGIDNDMDGSQFTDCADPDCFSTIPCEVPTELTCDDTFDNDGDGLVDCDDQDCALSNNCIGISF